MPSHNLIPPPELSPPSIAELAPAERTRLWAQMVEEGDEIVFSGFVREHPDEAAARRAAEKWLDRRAGDALAAKIRWLARSQVGESDRGR